MDMKYHARFPHYIQKQSNESELGRAFHFAATGEETEEGEINDASDVEDVDSNPSSPKSNLLLSKSKTLGSLPVFVANQKSQRSLIPQLENCPLYAVNECGPLSKQALPRLPNSVPSAPLPRQPGISNFPPPINNVYPQRTPYMLPPPPSNGAAPCLPFPAITPVDKLINSELPVVSQNSTTELVKNEGDLFDGLHDLEKMQLRMQLEEMESVKSDPPVSSGGMDGGFVGAMLPFMSGLPTMDKAHMAVASMWFPAAPPPLTGVTGGSQKEIQRMHRLYHKACRLYERAVAKLSSTTGGAGTIDFSCLPQPPSFPMIVAHNPVTSTGVAGCEAEARPVGSGVSPGQTETTYLPVSSAVTSVPTAAIPITAAAHSPEVYSAAYASAYRQTMTVMPKPSDGGPPPNTPEYTALWRCYLDYYLQYYLQHQPAAGRLSTGVDTAVASSSSVGTLPVTSWSMANGVDSSPPTKRIRTVSGDWEEQVSSDQTAGGHTSSPTSVEGRHQRLASASTLQSQDTTRTSTRLAASSAKVEVIKATKTLLESETTSEDGVETSKCVWISNLPTGVRAVDVKERCTPFGRVQTIKIIGSRKSKTPSIFAYLVMETVDAAVRLVDGLQGQTFQDKEIKIKRINALPIS